MNSLLHVIVISGFMQSGKGTLCKHLMVKNKGIYYISSGELVRYHLENETPIGIRIMDEVSCGNYINCDTISALCLQEVQRIVTETDILVLDGFPRTCKQVEAMTSFLEKKRPNYKLIHIAVTTPSSVCRDRALRAAEGKGDRFSRTDAKMESFENRLKADMAHMHALGDSLKDKGAQVVHIDGTNMLDNITIYSSDVMQLIPATQCS